MCSLALLSATAQGPEAPCTPQQYGAKADGMTVDTIAIQKAIDACIPAAKVAVLGGADNVGTAIQITEHYGSPKGMNGGNAGTLPVTRLTPHLHDFTLGNIKVTWAKVAMELDGLPEAPIEGIRLKNVVLNSVKGATINQATVLSEGLVIEPQSGPPITPGVNARGSLK